MYYICMCVCVLATTLRTGQSGVPILVWERDFSYIQSVQISSEADAASYLIDTGFCPGDKVAWLWSWPLSTM
jgi:hypothetical protein